jgi:predicted RNase H-like HicB family nuclease
MDRTRSLMAIIAREDDGYVSLCPELDIASQGGAIEEARANLVEASTLFFETASPSEVDRRLRTEVLVTQVEIPIG